MANREWNPKSFFRHLTPDALQVLQEWADVDLTLDGEGPLGEQVYRAWKALPEDERERIETALLPVNDMCAPHARPYLEQLALVVWTNGMAKLIDAQFATLNPAARQDAELARELMLNHARRLRVYRCQHCNFRSKTFFWRCPACGEWESFTPNRSEALAV